MLRLFSLTAFMALVLLSEASSLPPTTCAAQVQDPISAGASSEEIPRDAIPQNSPCIGQPKSHRELPALFAQGRAPLASEITGTWVQIGNVYKDQAVRSSLNCSGIRRGGAFEFVLVADGYSVALHPIGTYSQQAVMRPNHKGSIEFPVDFEADEGPDTYTCRLTKRGTLACVDADTGEEFKKMKVDASLIYEGLH